MRFQIQRPTLNDLFGFAGHDFVPREMAVLNSSH
jgi:hypothetical protein